jgi:hypothetical protein
LGKNNFFFGPWSPKVGSQLSAQWEFGLKEWKGQMEIEKKRKEQKRMDYVSDWMGEEAGEIVQRLREGMERKKEERMGKHG